MDRDQSSVTELLLQMERGDASIVPRLFPLVYNDLERIAHQKLQYERRNHTLNTHDLVHESYLKLIDQNRVAWKSRTHFFAIAAQAMRRILVNHAERRNALKRMAPGKEIPLNEACCLDRPKFPDSLSSQILALNEAIERLKQFNPRGYHVVEYRFFGGMTHGEIAEALGLTVITVRRSWVAAKTWLRKEMVGQLSEHDSKGFLLSVVGTNDP